MKHGIVRIPVDSAGAVRAPRTPKASHPAAVELAGAKIHGSVTRLLPMHLLLRKPLAGGSLIQALIRSLTAAGLIPMAVPLRMAASMPWTIQGLPELDEEMSESAHVIF